jgi:hypothetical protein
MRHSAELREFRLSSHGFEVLPSYQSGGQLLMGTAAAAARRASARRRAAIEGQIEALRQSLADEIGEEAAQTSEPDLPGEPSGHWTDPFPGPQPGGVDTGERVP